MEPRYYRPFNDGRTLARNPFELVAGPLSADFPMILVNTPVETRFLIGASAPETSSLTWKELTGKLGEVAPFPRNLQPAEVVRPYRALYLVP